MVYNACCIFNYAFECLKCLAIHKADITAKKPTMNKRESLSEKGMISVFLQPMCTKKQLVTKYVTVNKKRLYVDFKHTNKAILFLVIFHNVLLTYRDGAC